jgi:hypothetical protein
MDTFTAQELAELYKKAAEGGEIEFRYPTRTEWKTTNCGPTPLSSPNDWRIKPAKKVIDLSVLIDGIDCEFWDDETDQSVYKLTSINCCSYPYEAKGESTRFCRPRMNHIHAWQGGDCPLPEGFEVRVWLRDSDSDSFSALAAELTWSHGNNKDDIITFGDIIAFEVLRVADGYVMPWGSE